MSKVAVEVVYLKSTRGATLDVVEFRRKEDGVHGRVQMGPDANRDKLGVYVAFLKWCEANGYEV